MALPDVASAPRDRRIGVVLALALLDAAIAVYLARDGVTAPATLLLATSPVLLVAATWRPPAAGASALEWTLGIVLLGHVLLRLGVPYRVDAPPPEVSIAPVAGLALITFGLVALGARFRRPGLIAAGLAVVTLLGLAGRAMLVNEVPATFDVHLIQAAAGEALLDGRNPYPTFVWPDGFPYLPVAAVAGAFGRVLGSDAWPTVAADAVTALALVLLGRMGGQPRLGLLAAAVWAWLAGSWYMTWQAFPEPVLIAPVALATVVLARRPAGATVTPGRTAVVAGILLGVAVAVKQFGFGLLPFLWFGPRGHRVAFGVSLAVAAAIIVPFALLDLEVFLNGAVLSHLTEPPRAFALNLVNHPFALPKPVVPVALAVAIGFGFGWLVARPWRDPQVRWLAGSSGLLFGMFLVNPLSFVNYYQIVLATLLLLVAHPGARPAGQSAHGMGRAA